MGFGDVVIPGVVPTTYPTLLDHPAPTIRAYSRESVVAEKLEAMVTLGISNSRMKDFYDLWVLLQRFELNDKTLRQAISATFERRRTPTPSGLPTAFTEEFAGNADKQKQWQAFLNRSGLSGGPQLVEVIAVLRERLSPLLGPGDQLAKKRRGQRD